VDVRQSEAVGRTWILKGKMKVLFASVFQGPEDMAQRQANSTTVCKTLPQGPAATLRSQVELEYTDKLCVVGESP